MASKGLAALLRTRESALAHGCGRGGRVVLPLARAAAVSTGLKRLGQHACEECDGQHDLLKVRVRVRVRVRVGVRGRVRVRVKVRVRIRVRVRVRIKVRVRIRVRVRPRPRVRVGG